MKKSIKQIFENEKKKKLSIPMYDNEGVDGGMGENKIKLSTKEINEAINIAFKNVLEKNKINEATNNFIKKLNESGNRLKFYGDEFDDAYFERMDALMKQSNVNIKGDELSLYIIRWKIHKNGLTDKYKTFIKQYYDGLTDLNGLSNLIRSN